MAAAADLTLKNAAAANVTYNPYSINESTVEWLESGGTSMLTQKIAALGRKIPANRATGVLRVPVKFTYPVLNGTTGLVDGTFTFKGEILRPVHLPTADYNEFIARVAAFVGVAVVAEAGRSGAIPT